MNCLTDEKVGKRRPFCWWLREIIRCDKWRSSVRKRDSRGGHFFEGKGTKGIVLVPRRVRKRSRAITHNARARAAKPSLITSPSSPLVDYRRNPRENTHLRTYTVYTVRCASNRTAQPVLNRASRWPVEYRGLCREYYLYLHNALHNPSGCRGCTSSTTGLGARRPLSFLSFLLSFYG